MKNIIIEKLTNLKNDVTFSEDENVLDITFNDFDGFDEDWCEISREYNNPSMVDELLDFLEESCEEFVEDYYTTYIFNDCQVVVGYASFDI